MLDNCDYFMSSRLSCSISCVGIGIRDVHSGLSGLYINQTDTWSCWDVGASYCDRFHVTEDTGLSDIGLVEVGCHFGYEERAGSFGMWLPSLTAQGTVGACQL